LHSLRAEGYEDQGEQAGYQNGKQVFNPTDCPELSKWIQTHHQAYYNFWVKMLPDIPPGAGLVIQLTNKDILNFKTIASDEGIIRLMTDFHFYHLIEVRYGDLDPQGHVNNAKFLTYMEQARVFYLKQLKLWEGGSFMDIGIILADVQISFQKALQFGDPIRVGVRISSIGNKSMTSEYSIEDERDESVFATGSSVLVAYDYRNRRSVPIPEEWRTAIQQFEAMTEKG